MICHRVDGGRPLAGRNVPLFLSALGVLWGGGEQGGFFNHEIHEIHEEFEEYRMAGG